MKTRQIGKESSTCAGLVIEPQFDLLYPQIVDWWESKEFPLPENDEEEEDFKEACVFLMQLGGAVVFEFLGYCRDRLQTEESSTER